MIFKRTHLIILASIAISSSAFGQVQEAADNFKVPSYETKTLDVHGQDLFFYNDAGNLKINLGSDFLMTNQTPELAWSVSNSLEIKMEQADKDANMTQSIVESLGASYRQFFNGDRGVSAIVKLGVVLDMDKKADEGAEMTKAMNALVGVGVAYGRKFNARTLAQGAAMCKASGKSCTAADLQTIADIMGKQAAGYYEANFKADAAVEFNKDLSAATGGTAAKNAQVLDSPIYNIGDRNTGWEAGALMNLASGDHLSDDGEADAGQAMWVSGFAGYAMLLDDNSGINLDVGVEYGMKNEYAGASGDNTKAIDDALETHPGKDNMVIRVDLGYNIDHSSNWNSGADVYFNYNKPKEGDATNSWGLHIETNYALGTQAVAGLNVNLCGGDADTKTGDAELVDDNGENAVPNNRHCATGEDKIHWNAGAQFTYYIF